MFALKIVPPEKDEAARRQDEFMLLYAPVHERINRYAQSLTKNNEDAKDLLSDTLLVAFENFDKIEKKESFAFFLFGVASRLFKQRLRKNKWWGAYDSEQAERIPGGYSAPELNADVAMLYKAMEKLPGTHREALVLFELSGLTNKEIADIQGVTESAVKSRIARSHEKLATLLTDEPMRKVVRMPLTLITLF